MEVALAARYITSASGEVWPAGRHLDVGIDGKVEQVN